MRTNAATQSAETQAQAQASVLPFVSCKTIAALRLARHEGQDGRFMGHAPYVAHGPRNALRTGSLIGRHLYLCTMTVVVT